MKKAIILAVSILAFIGMGFAKPPQADAIPSINPICWIADHNNPAIKKGCKGHDWSWPHWGGSSSYDGPNRACGNGPIWGQTIQLTTAEANAYKPRGTSVYYGQLQYHLTLVDSKQYDRKFWPDYIVYTWQPQYTFTFSFNVGYGRGAPIRKYTYDNGSSYKVTCNMKGKIK